MSTLEELLQNHILWPTHKIVSGASGLNRTVSGAGRLEVPDFTVDRHPQELLFTTGYFFSADNADTQRQLIRRLYDHDIPGLVLKTQRYLPGFPQPMRDEADVHGFPLVEVDPQTNLNHLIQEVIRFVRTQHTIPSWLSDLQHHMMAHGTFTALAEFLRSASNVRLALVDPGGFVYPCDSGPIARQIFVEQWTIHTHPVYHREWVRVSCGSYVGEGIAFRLDANANGPEKSNRLVLYTERKTITEITAYLGFWLSIVPFLRLLAKTAIDQFWLCHKGASETWVSQTESDDTVLTRWGIDEAVPKQWIAVSCSPEPPDPWTIAELYRMRHQLIGVTLTVGSRILMLWQPPPSPESLLTLYPSMSRLVLSPIFQELSAARRYYNLVLTASATAPQTGRQRLVDYSTNLVFPLLDYIPEEASQSFVQHVLGPLIEGETVRQDLLDTLVTFFETNSLKDTAARLHVHYNTVVYRLDQLEKLLNRNVHNHDERLELLLATFLWNKTLNASNG